MAATHRAALGGLLLMALCVSGCGSFGLMTANGLARLGRYDVERDLAYGPEPAQRLDVYRPRQAEPAPVVVFFYGGRWSSGSRSTYTFVGQALTSRGFVAVIPDFRKFPEVRFPAFVRDAAAAVAWARSNAEELGGDPDAVFVMGHSSGAHMAALLALDGRYLGAHAPFSPRVRGMIGLAGPYDFNERREDIREIFAGASHDDTQPIAFASAAHPPLLLLHGEADRTVFKKNAVNLAAAVKRAGGRVRTRYYADCDHTCLLAALSIPLRGSRSVLEDITGFIRKESGP